MTLRTSQTDPLHIDTLEAGNGLIGITLCPGKHQTGAWLGTWRRDLATDMKAIEAWGASDVVTLIENHEFTELEVTGLGDAVRQAGMRWHHLPITDGCAPDARFEHDWPPVRDTLLDTLANHGRVLVHCKGGLGRAGTVAALLLHAAEPPLSIAEALHRVRAARKGAVETHEQETWLLSRDTVR